MQETLVSPVEIRESAESGSASVSPIRHWFSSTGKFLWRLCGWVHSFLEVSFGLVALIILLAIIAAIPGVNLLALGVLLAAEGNVARTGNFTHGFGWLKPAARIGRLVLGSLLFLLPLSYLGHIAADAYLIDPDSLATKRLRLAAGVGTLLVTCHLLLAMARGGDFRDFFRPRKNWRWLRAQFQQGAYLETASRHVAAFVSRLELWRHLKLGFFGAVGILMWTLFPTTLYAFADSSEGPGVLITLLGGGLLTVVLGWLPILQAGYARDEEFAIFRRVREARRLFARSPALWTLVFLLGYALSLVLYLFKVVAPPRDAVWLLTVFFIAVVYPARLLAGWVYHWSSHRPKPAWIGWRWLWNLLCLGICGFYVFLLFFTRNIGAHGKLVLFEQPFLLIPSPF